MRKWMRDRLKRRKKTAEPTQGNPQTAPLQPAYFDQAAPGEAEAIPAREKLAEASEAPFEGAGEGPDAVVYSEPSEPGSAEQPETGPTDTSSRRRRRRGRGGRGRSAPPVKAGSETSPTTPEIVSQAPPARSSEPKGVVVLAIGLPGSGKSSWFKRNNITPLSSDMLRALLFDDPTEQRFQDLIFSNLRSLLKARLVARRPMNYVDATNLTPHDRHSWIKLAKDFGYEVQALFFDVPLEVCLERNKKRQRVVEEDVMRRFAAKLKAPAFEEGFSKITVVRVKHKDNVAV